MLISSFPCTVMQQSPPWVRPDLGALPGWPWELLVGLCWPSEEATINKMLTGTVSMGICEHGNFHLPAAASWARCCSTTGGEASGGAARGGGLPAPQGPAATHPTVSAQQDARTHLHTLHTQSQIIFMSSIGNPRLLLSPQVEFQLFSFPLSITPFLSAKEITKQALKFWAMKETLILIFCDCLMKTITIEGARWSLILNWSSYRILFSLSLADPCHSLHWSEGGRPTVISHLSSAFTMDIAKFWEDRPWMYADESPFPAEPA